MLAHNALDRRQWEEGVEEYPKEVMVDVLKVVMCWSNISEDVKRKDAKCYSEGYTDD
jgi:hypothetical protein